MWVQFMVNTLGCRNQKLQVPSLIRHERKLNSIILLPLCDADYKFTMFDPMAYLREDDKSVFSSSFILQQLENDSLKISPQQNYRIVKFNCLIALLMMMVFPKKLTLWRPLLADVTVQCPKNLVQFENFRGQKRSGEN